MHPSVDDNLIGLADAPELLGHEFRARQIYIGKAKDKELVGIRDLVSIRIGNSLQKSLSLAIQSV